MKMCDLKRGEKFVFKESFTPFLFLRLDGDDAIFEEEWNVGVFRREGARDAEVVKINRSPVQFQVVYKQRVYNDGYDNHLEAIDGMEEAISHGIDPRALAVEVMIERDVKRQDGIADSRITWPEIAAEFVTKRLMEAEDKIDKMKKILGV